MISELILSWLQACDNVSIKFGLPVTELLWGAHWEVQILLINNNNFNNVLLQNLSVSFALRAAGRLHNTGLGQFEVGIPDSMKLTRPRPTLPRPLRLGFLWHPLNCQVSVKLGEYSIKQQGLILLYSIVQQGQKRRGFVLIKPPISYTSGLICCTSVCKQVKRWVHLFFCPLKGELAYAWRFLLLVCESNLKNTSLSSVPPTSPHRKLVQYRLKRQLFLLVKSWALKCGTLWNRTVKKKKEKGEGGAMRWKLWLVGGL